MKLRKYTLAELKHAVSISLSYRETLQKLNVVAAGGNYQTLKKAIKYFNLDSSHFLGRSVNKGKTFSPKRPIEDYLNNKQTIQSYKLKNRLLKDGLLEKVCSHCEKREWMGFPIPLELHHVDGDSNNNNLNNLEILCPNCHAFTDNYRAKKRSS